MEWKGYAGKININGTYFKLQQCHWHSPSEHTFNGSRLDFYSSFNIFIAYPEKKKKKKREPKKGSRIALPTFFFFNSIFGCRYNLELHVIHLSSDEKIAVIGITYKYGRADPFLTRVRQLDGFLLLLILLPRINIPT